MSYSVQINLILGVVATATMAWLSTAGAAPPAGSYNIVAPAYAYDSEGCLDNTVEFDAGFGCWVYHDTGANRNKPVRVWYYYPPNYSSGSKTVLFAMHGSSRHADEAIERWQPYADTYGALLVAPEFSKQHYPKERHYGRGNVRDDRGEIRDRNDWTYMTVEEIFNQIRREIPDAPNSYSIQGHSGGAQFVHRLVYMLPEARVETAVSSSAGWYLQPDEYEDYPCGISDVAPRDEDLEKSYAKDLVVTLGTDDDDPYARGLNHEECAEAQGAHRYERGHFFYSNARADARSRGHRFNWTVEDVLGADHEADSMVETGAEAIFGQKSLPARDITLLPTHDAIVKANYPRSNYGARNILQVDGNSLKTTYMQFDLRNLQTVGSAVLMLKITDSSNDVQYVRKVAQNNWDEDTLTYNNRPAATTKIATINGGAKGSWVSIDITDHVVANKGRAMSIALESPNSNGLSFNSKEASNDPPELVIYD